MARKNKSKLVSLDDECWRILYTESKPRMQSVYVRNAIKHYYLWRNGNTETYLEREQMEMINDVLNQRDEALMKIKGLQKRLEKYPAKQERKLSKWWHFFYVGFRK